MDGEKQLYDAARNGNLAKFRQLLQTNPHLVDVVSFSLLHIAIKHGQEIIVEEVLNINQELALDLDSKNSSSLHIAAARGNVEITKRLLLIAPEMCWWRDCHDMNPVHLAAMKGHEEVLKVMIQLDYLPAMERVQRGKTALHLCVQYRQLETLKILVDELRKGHVCATDDDGETALHLAVRSNQLEMILYLVQSNKIKDVTKNSMGNTEEDILDEKSRDKITRRKIKRMLDTLSIWSTLKEMVPHFNDTTMVVVVLITAMAFQAAVSPPGGMWQEDTSSHSAGKSVMASTHPNIYKHFVRANSTAFVSSLFTIFLITTGVANEYIFFLMLATYTMWVSMGSIAVSYGVSLSMTNPMGTLSVGHLVRIVLYVFFGFGALRVIIGGLEVVYKWLVGKERRRMDLTTLLIDTTRPKSAMDLLSELSERVSNYIQSRRENLASPGRTQQAVA